MIALYIIAIVVVCGLVVFYFFWRRRKRNQRLIGLKLEKEGKNLPATKAVESDLKEAEKEVIKEEKKIEAELENFSLTDEGEKVDEDNPSLKSAKFDGEDEFLKGLGENFFEDRMQSYEQFLKEEQERFEREEVEDLTDEEQQDINALMDFDFDSLKGKTREQVQDMIKDLSPTVQDFILNDIFERKNSED